MSTWTSADQAQLQELLDRKSDFVNRHRHAVVNAATLVCGESNGTYLVDRFIRHADVIRDALAPFDSGVRPAKAE